MSALVFKDIKPQRLKVEAMRAELIKGMNDVADGVEQDYQKTTATWRHKPKFERLFDLGPPITVLVGTDDEIYGYVDRGTRRHLIFPKRAKALSFVWGGPGSYTAKTVPNVIGSRAGGPSGDRVARAWVDHPGSAPRNFSKEIQKKWTPRFKRRMEKAMSQAAKASGHGL